MRTLILIMALCALPFAAGAETGLRVDDQSAVVLMYYRVGDDANPASNIRLEQFESHLRTLKEEQYNVVPLKDIVAAIRADAEIDDKTVAITFDGIHRSILDNAIPLLNSHKFPYTLFIPTTYADQDEGDYLTWDQLKKLKNNGLADFGLQSSYYAHLNQLENDDMTRGVNNARARFREMLGDEPAFYAYPFGEISADYRSLIEKQGFTAAFGQQSGVLSPTSDKYAMPRFVMTESYGDLERFETAINALPLPITALEPSEPYLDNRAPAIGFTLPPALAEREDFRCYASGATKPEIQRLGNGRVELRFNEALATDRVRINCTVAQGTDDPENPYRWRWFGMMFTVKGEADSQDASQQADSSLSE